MSLKCKLWVAFREFLTEVIIWKDWIGSNERLVTNQKSFQKQTNQSVTPGDELIKTLALPAGDVAKVFPNFTSFTYFC